MSRPLLDVQSVGKTYLMGGILSRRRVAAVQEVSFRLDPDRPEIFTIVGESGRGKSTLAQMILGIVGPTTGRIVFEGTDLAELRGGAARLRFMRHVQPIFQNPFEAFNPLKRVDRYLFMTARRFAEGSAPQETERRVDEALHKVGLSLAEVRGRYPHELSGGQLQRVAIARAIVCAPTLLVADEPVSMVDASLRTSIVNLFMALRDDLRVSIIYITHDLATAYYISDRIIIMQKGQVVESGDARSVLAAPRHPYSILLKSSVLSPDDVGRDRLGEAAPPAEPVASPSPVPS
jgi:ABC-type glutathione transport system ATPase component